MPSRLSLAAAMLIAGTACSGNSETSPKATANVRGPEAFTGTWRSVTPTFEFIGLSVVSKSSEQGVLGARLTFSGVAWDGAGRIDADSLMLGMNVAGTTQATGVLVIRSRDGKMLEAQVRSNGGIPFNLTFVRE